MKCRRQITILTSYILHLSLISFHKRLFSLPWFGVQVMLDYKFYLLQTIGMWGPFITFRDLLVLLNCFQNFISSSNFLKIVSNSARMHHFASLLLKCFQQFQLQEHRFKLHQQCKTLVYRSVLQVMSSHIVMNVCIIEYV